MEPFPVLSRVGLNDLLKHRLPAAVEAAAASLGLAEAGWGPGGGLLGASVQEAVGTGAPASAASGASPLSQRFAGDDSQRCCKPRAAAGLELIVWKEGSATGGREVVFPRLISVSQAWLGGTSLERDVCCLQRELHLLVPSLAAPGAQGLVSWWHPTIVTLT